MSESNIVIPRLNTPNSAGLPTTTADQTIAMARDLPDMIAKAEKLDPALAAKFTGTALVASKTFWGTATALLVAAAVRRYGLGWGQDTVDIVSGGIVLATVAALRVLSDGPITGWFSKKTAAQAGQQGTTP